MKLIEIKINNLEERLKWVYSSKLKKIKKKFKRYEGTFLICKDNLIKVPRIPFVKYRKGELDANQIGVFPAIVYNNFYGGIPHAHFENGHILNFKRTNYIGKIV